jgi:hypothetical protein
LGRIFPGLVSFFYLVEDLMHVDVGLGHSNDRRSQCSKFGFIPSCRDAEIGALNAESFDERINSAINLVMTDGRTLLDDATLGKLVLRMNHDFGFYAQAIFR